VVQSLMTGPIVTRLTMTTANHFVLSSERAALEAAWQFFLREEMDVSFASVVAYVRARSPGVAAARVRAEFTRRFRQAGVGRPAVTAQPAALPSR
jgi:hypothetical protein